jgi:hypothetical protein
VVKAARCAGSVTTRQSRCLLIWQNADEASAILFDVEGTLVNATVRCWQETLHQFGLKFSLDLELYPLAKVTSMPKAGGQWAIIILLRRLRSHHGATIEGVS